MYVVGNDYAARILEVGLGASGLRQRVIAHNMANIQTPGYKRSRVEFETQLAAALRMGKNPNEVQPQVKVDRESLGRPDGNNVDLEGEMMQMAANQLWYAAMTRNLSDHFGRLRTVIHEGRR